MKIDFEKLIIEKFILEVKFSNGYLYWDNCGKIWRKICKKWTGFNMLDVNVEEANFTIHDEGFSLKFSDKYINLVQDYPSSLTRFKEIAKDIFPLISGELEITTFDRIGNRIIYLYPVKDIIEAERLMDEMPIFSIPKDKIKLFGETLNEPSIKFIIQTEDIGYIFNIGVFSRELTVKLPKPLKIDKSDFIEHYLMIDVDFYTKKPIDISSTDFEGVINKFQKNLKHNLITLIQ